MPELPAAPRRWSPWLTLAGVIVGGCVWWLVPSSALTHEGRAVAGVAALMAFWWMTAAVPLEATGLVPFALFPMLGVFTPAQAAASYASDSILLFLGGMLLGKALEAWGLHRRLAMGIVGAVGASPARLVAGFLAATALASMWISNTAAAVMMIPVALGVASLVRRAQPEDDSSSAGPRDDALAGALLLAIAYGSSIGGLGTLIGTPPLVQFAGFVRGIGDLDITFASYLRVGLPLVLLLLPIAFLVLTRVAIDLRGAEPAGVRELLGRERARLGRLEPGAWITLVVFLLAGLGWVTTSWTGLSDAGIAVVAALVLLAVPASWRTARPVLTWEQAAQIPWGVLVLFGGGLSLAKALSAHGVDAAIAGGLTGLSGVPLPLLLFVVALGTILLSELASNVAMVALLLPIAAAAAPSLGVPREALMLTVTLSACMSFMLPVGTPPNALVFATGRVPLRKMLHAGILLDLCGAVVVPLVVLVLMELGAGPVFDAAPR